MCEEHSWLFSGCRHTWRAKSHCEAARRAKRQAESGCCGLWSSTPRKVCQVRYQTHYDPRPCRQCQRAARERIDREARETAEARAQAKRAAEKYGWRAAALRGGNGVGASDGTGRDSYISTGLYQQAVNILPESEYRRHVPPPPGRVATTRMLRGYTRRIGASEVLPPLPIALTRDQVRRGAGGPDGRGRWRQQDPEPSQRGRREIRDSYHNMMRSAGFPLPLPQQRHEASDEHDEPLPDDDFLAMVSRVG